MWFEANGSRLGGYRHEVDDLTEWNAPVQVFLDCFHRL